MFIYASKYPVSYYTAEDFGIQVKVHPANYVYGCHVGEQVSFSAMANISCLIQTFKQQCFGLQLYFELIQVHKLKTKSDFYKKKSHYMIDYITNLSPISLNLAYIEYLLCQIWSVYMRH